MDNMHTCQVCGKQFESWGNYGQKYCSYRCSNDAYISRRREIAQSKREQFQDCVVCGTSIEQSGAKIRYYCCAACKQKAYRSKIKPTHIAKNQTNNEVRKNVK